jgi:hypothetical protein
MEFDRVLCEAVRAGLAPRTPGKGRRFLQKTYSLGSDVPDPKEVFAKLDELEDRERLRKMGLGESR